MFYFLIHNKPVRCYHPILQMNKLRLQKEHTMAWDLLSTYYMLNFTDTTVNKRDPSPSLLELTFHR